MFFLLFCICIAFGSNVTKHGHSGSNFTWNLSTTQFYEKPTNFELGDFRSIKLIIVFSDDMAKALVKMTLLRYGQIFQAGVAPALISVHSLYVAEGKTNGVEEPIVHVGCEIFLNSEYHAECNVSGSQDTLVESIPMFESPEFALFFGQQVRNSFEEDIASSSSFIVRTVEIYNSGEFSLTFSTTLDETPVRKLSSQTWEFFALMGIIFCAIILTACICCFHCLMRKSVAAQQQIEPGRARESIQLNEVKPDPVTKGNLDPDVGEASEDTGLLSRQNSGSSLHAAHRATNGGFRPPQQLLQSLHENDPDQYIPPLPDDDSANSDIYKPEPPTTQGLEVPVFTKLEQSSTEEKQSAQTETESQEKDSQKHSPFQGSKQNNLKEVGNDERKEQLLGPESDLQIPDDEYPDEIANFDGREMKDDQQEDASDCSEALLKASRLDIEDSKIQHVEPESQDELLASAQGNDLQILDDECPDENASFDRKEIKDDEQGASDCSDIEDANIKQNDYASPLAVVVTAVESDTFDHQNLQDDHEEEIIGLLEPLNTQEREVKQVEDSSALGSFFSSAFSVIFKPSPRVKNNNDAYV